APKAFWSAGGECGDGARRDRPRRGAIGARPGRPGPAVAVTEWVPLPACRGLEKDFSGPSGIVPVLKGVDFSAAAGESVGVIGRSGSGKSAFLGIPGLLHLP